MQRTALVTSFLALALALFVLLRPIPAPPMPAPPHLPDRALALLISAALAPPLQDLTNQARAASPVPATPLIPDAQLTWMAQFRADEMAYEDYYAHVNPATYTSARSILASFGGFNTQVGENLWQCQSFQECTPELIHDTFMASPSHRANLLHPSYTHAGYGFSTGRDNQLYIVELFSDQSSGFVRPKP